MESSSSSPSALSELWHRFREPPDGARPRVWWHWMDGNVDPAGIVRDLTWLQAVGVRGVQLFDGGMGVPLVVPTAVRPGSPAWTEAIDTAVSTAARLGLELAVATSSGWSASGAPWVEPADAMKKLVWAETVVEGGGGGEGEQVIDLPALPATAGLFQEYPRWGAPARDPWSTDWRVVAVPAHPAHEPLRPARLHTSALSDDRAAALPTVGAPISLPRDPDGWSSAWVEQEFTEPVVVRSVTVGLPGPRGFGAAPPPRAVLQASTDGEAYRDVAELAVTTVPVRTVTFPAVTARRFRLVVSGASAAEALPPVAPGVRIPPVLRRADAFLITEFSLRAGARIHHGEVKAGFGVVADYYAAETPAGTAAEPGTVSVADVHDLTLLVRDGVLRWSVPPGRWRILRFGASLTGQTNGPSLPDRTGLEVDKLDGERVAGYLSRHLSEFGASSGFDALLSDSIEAGSQNWTDALAERFRELRGYDPTPWLPALAGFIVADSPASDRFLYDVRRTLAELIASQYYGTLAAEAHQRGMTYYAEALEDGRPQLGDDLAMRAHADVPMGAMWTFDADDGPQPTYVADLKGAASVAHVHGKAWTGSEAFTSFDRPWSSSPRSLKHVADLQLALGVTRFCLHTSPHQPLDAPPPGIALAPFLGQVFTVHETWADMAAPWIDYLARCSAVLSAGTPAVDVAVFVGEEAPVTGLFADRFDDSVPPGFDFDYVGPGELGLLRVEDGEIVSLGARYRALYLGGSSRRLTVSALTRVAELLDAGATIVGERPASSPSLSDDDAAFAQACDRIWGESGSRGRTVDTTDLASALRLLGLTPAFEVTGARVRTIARLVDGHRVTFVANPAGRDAHARVLVPADVGPLSVWDPVLQRATALRTHPAPDGRARFDLDLPAYGAVFVVPGTPVRASAPSAVAGEAVDDTWSLELPGRDEIDMPRGPAPWTTIDEPARGFSGTATYRTTWASAAASGNEEVFLDLGDVADIARVVVNGIDCGVAWTAPFRVDITHAVRAGLNTVEVLVATPWRNRLIAEAAEASGSLFPPATGVFEPGAAPLTAGLAGPVTIRRERVS